MTAYTSMHFRRHEALESPLLSLPRRRRAGAESREGQVLRPFMAGRDALQELRRPPGLEPSGATSALNASAEVFHPGQGNDRAQPAAEEPSSFSDSGDLNEWWDVQQALQFVWAQQSFGSRPRVKYRPPPPKGICRWCEQKPAVSRRRCEDCQQSDDAKKKTTDARSEEERARMKNNNRRRKWLPGAQIKNLQHQQKKQQVKWLQEMQEMREQLQKKCQQYREEMQEELQKQHQEMLEELQKTCQQYRQELQTQPSSC